MPNATNLANSKTAREAHTHDAENIWIRAVENLNGRFTAWSGFELATSATPSRFRPAGPGGEDGFRFPGEREFTRDAHDALEAFTSELPLGAGLWSEYSFSPVGDSNVKVRFRLLVESESDSRTNAIARSQHLRDELGVCLRVMSDWFSFRPAAIMATDLAQWQKQTIDFRPKPRRFTGAHPTMGFLEGNAAKPTASIYLAQPAGLSENDRNNRNTVQDFSDSFLLLRSTGRAALNGCLRAARGLQSSLAVRIGMRREALSTETLLALQRVSATLSATEEGQKATNGTGVARVAAFATINELLLAPECFSLHCHAAGDPRFSRAWLRILAQELLPEFLPRFSVVAQPGVFDSGIDEDLDEAEAGAVPCVDLSRLFAPGSAMPPLFPSPPCLERLGFPKHFANPSAFLPEAGMLLGEAQIGGVQSLVRLPESVRHQHCYLLGATGTGKSTLMFNMITQDMEAGNGLILMDPHGDLFEQCLESIPKNRLADLVIIDPSDKRFLPELNCLDFGAAPTLREVNRVTNDLLDIFDRQYDLKQAGGPGFEDMFRNTMIATAALVKANAENLSIVSPTLLHANEVLRDRDLLVYALERVEKIFGKEAGQRVNSYFDSMRKQVGEQHFANWVPYVSSKLTRLTSNETVRQMICAPRCSVNFRELMDQRRIVLVNLSKGILGSADVRFIGMLLTKMIFHAAMSRVDVPRSQRQPVYFYLDEFQNFVGADFDDILAEGRKFGLHLVLANQTLGQLKREENSDLLDAVIGNVATKLIMRVGLREAALLEPSFLPDFDGRTLMELPDHHVLCRMLIEDQPSMPFVFETHPAQRGDGALRGGQVRESVAARMVAAPGHDSCTVTRAETK